MKNSEMSDSKFRDLSLRKQYEIINKMNENIGIINHDIDKSKSVVLKEEGRRDGFMDLMEKASAAFESENIHCHCDPDVGLCCDIGGELPTRAEIKGLCKFLMDNFG